MSMEAQTAEKPKAAEKKKRKKRSWTSVKFTTVEGEEWKFWLTPGGLHARKRASRRVWEITSPAELVDFITGQRHLPI